MKILIVDDNPRRYQRLIGDLQAAGLAQSDIDIVTCANDAREKLQAIKYDLMVIDIVLPLRPEHAPDERHSQELVSELIEFQGMIRPRQIVGLSAFEATTDKVTPFFREHLWTVITYSDSNDEWLSQILNCVNYLIGTSKERKQRSFKTDIAIVCALPDPELRAVLALPWSWGAARPLDDVTFIHDGRFEVKGRSVSLVAAATSRMGMVSAALLSAKLIEELRPKFLVMSGICAGIRGKVNIGDVLFIDPTWDWQSGKRSRERNSSTFSMAPHQLGVASNIRACIEQLRADRVSLSSIASEWMEEPPHQLKIVIGPVASGSAVLADGTVVAEVRQQHRDLCGIEMEAYGVYLASATASFPRPAAFALKSVCDFAEPDKDDRFRRYAAYTSAATLKVFLEKFFPQLSDGI